jgi:hypothetical protein
MASVASREESKMSAALRAQADATDRYNEELGAAVAEAARLAQAEWAETCLAWGIAGPKPTLQTEALASQLEQARHVIAAMTENEKECHREIDRLTGALAKACEALESIISNVQAWCTAIEENGASWDDWDEHYKGFAHHGGLDYYRNALAATKGA